jgi:hypothetical protein
MLHSLTHSSKALGDGKNARLSAGRPCGPQASRPIVPVSAPALGRMRPEQAASHQDTLGNQAVTHMMNAPSPASKAADGTGGETTPTQAALPAQPAAASPAPSLVSGSLTISSQPLAVTQQGGQVITVSRVYNVAKEFKVQASATITEPQSSEPFQYGVVQNVFYDHIEEVFTDGDMLVDSVGPMVDVADKAETPFIHADAGNLELSGSLFAGPPHVGPSFTDVPSLDVAGAPVHCKKAKRVYIRSADRSVSFRAGLVAKGMKTNQLVFLGGIDKTYNLKWHADFDFDANSWKTTDSSALDGSYALSTSAIPVTLGGTIGNDAGQAALKAETAAFEERCDNVLS